MICCYIYDGMADFEVTLLMHRLKNTGKKELVYISGDVKPIKAQSGLTYIPDKKIESIQVSELEAIIIPGGPINNEQNEICTLLKEAVVSKKLIAAICFAPQFLGRAGILDEYKYTTSCTKEKINQLGVEDPFNWNTYSHQRVVEDRNVITAQGFAFVDFSISVCRYLKIFENDIQLEQQLLRVKSDNM